MVKTFNKGRWTMTKRQQASRIKRITDAVNGAYELRDHLRAVNQAPAALALADRNEASASRTALVLFYAMAAIFAAIGYAAIHG
jgi:hypothetical protein